VHLLKLTYQWLYRITIGLLLVVLGLLILIALILEVPAVQKFTAKKAVSYVNQSLGIPLSLEKLEVNLPDGVALENLYLPDREQDTLLYLSKLEADVALFELLENKVNVEELTLEQVVAKVKRGANETDFNYQFILDKFSSDTTATQETTAPSWEISAAFIKLDDIDLLYKDGSTGFEQQLSWQSFSAQLPLIDLASNTVAIGDVWLKNAQSYTSIKSDTTERPEQQSTGQNTISISTGWNITAKSLRLEGSQVSYHDRLYPDTATIFDPSHFDLSGVQLNIENISLNDSAVSALLNNFSAQEQGGLAIGQLQAALTLGDSTKADIRDFLLVTPHTKAKFHLATSYISLNELMDLGPETAVDLDLIELSTSDANGYQDLAYFVPRSTLAPVQGLLNGLQLSGRLKGRPAQAMELDGLQLRVAEETNLSVSGQLRKLANPDSLAYRLALDSLFTTEKDLRALFTNFIPEGVSLPPNFTANAQVNGDLQVAEASAGVKTDFGELETQASWQNKTPNSATTINGKAQLARIELGSILQNEQLGNAAAAVTFNLSIPDAAETEIGATLDLSAFEWNKKALQNIGFDLQLIGESLTLKGNSLDSALAFDFQLASELKTVQKHQLDFQLHKANLVELGLSDSITHVDAESRITAQLTDLDDLNTTVDIDKLGFIRSSKPTQLKNINLTLFQQVDSLSFKSNSELLEVLLYSNLNLTEIAPEFTNYLSQYTDALESRPDTTANSFLNLTLNTKKQPAWHGLLVPGLDYTEQFSLRFDYRQASDHLELNCATDSMQISGIAFDRLALSLLNEGDFLKFDFKSNSIKNDFLTLYQPEVQARARQDTAQVALTVNDSTGAPNFYLNTSLSQQDTSFYLHIYSDTLLLNGQSWSVAPKNYLSLKENNLIVKDFALSKGDESLEVYTESTGQDLLKISFNQFKISNFLSVIGVEEEDLSGALHGEVTLTELFSNLQFDTDLELQSLEAYQVPLGNLQVYANNKDNNYNIDAQLRGKGNDLQLKGKYSPEKEALDMQADFASLDISPIEGLSQGYLKEVSGGITGILDVKGAPSDPEITGELQFDKSNFFIPYLNTGFSINGQRIAFEPTNIRFNGFTMLDQDENTAVINGQIIKNSLLDYAFDLDIDAESFKALDTKAGDNELYYGKVLVNSSMAVTGDVAAPTIDMSLELLPGSDITYLVQEDELLIEEQKGIVEFVQVNQQDTLQLQAAADSLTASGFTGLAMNISIKINEATKFTVVIDETAGDKLEIEGSGDLVYELQRNGNMTLTGRYVIDDGFYLLTFYGLVKKRFEIAEGSSVLWKGDPYDAALSIQAVYQTRTSPQALMSNMGDDGSQYQKPEVFQVLMNIRGELEKPQISFELDIPQEERTNANIYNTVRLLNQNEAALNKQVFALLVLNSFIGTSSEEQDIGNDFISSTARTSVSQLLTQQLNNLSEKFIKGVQLDLNLDSYGSGEQAGTDLQLGISKTLFDDRVTVEVGGSYQLEGEQQAANNALIGNVAIEYKITEDGRYRLRFYQMNDTNLLDGQITSTGLSIIFTRDYNKLKELFKKRADEE